MINPNFEVIQQKLSSLGQKEVARLSLFGMEPKCAIQLSNSKGRLVSSHTIYNCKAGQLWEKMQGMEPMQYLVHAVNSSNWVHHYEHNPEGELLYLFFAHPAAIQLARQFHHIAVIYATHKTNLCNYPLLPLPYPEGKCELGMGKTYTQFYKKWSEVKMVRSEK
jgi:hypothetical protein